MMRRISIITILLTCLANISHSFHTNRLFRSTCRPLQHIAPSRCSTNFSSSSTGSDAVQDALPSSFDDVVNSRYACTRFHRYKESTSDANDSHPTGTASRSDPEIVKSARDCLDISRRSPSGFNAQPYKLLMVHSHSKKEALAKYCLGRNADRVRDSDCTVVFLADKECLREYKRYGRFLDGRSSDKQKITSKWAKRKIQGLILLFSSGWPLPRFVANPVSFMLRVGVSAVSVCTRRKVLVPSLGSADTWASKNTMLVAMTYMLACTSKSLGK